MWALCAGLVLVLGACATPSLPPAEMASVTAGQTLRRVRGLYLYPDRLDRRMLVGALDALERRFDPVRFDSDGDSGVLWYGAERAHVPLSDDFGPGTYREILGGALQFVGRRLDPETLRPDEDLELIALRGSLRALDRYSTIFSGRGTEDFKIRFSGKLHGIGARIGRRDGHLTAVRVFPKSPAEKGGLIDGDAIIAIEGDPTRPLSVGDAVERIRGEVGSEVALTVNREEETVELTITRGEITVPTVETEMLEDGIGYARVLQMSRSTPKEFRDRVGELGRLSGLVLDLRQNSGGSMLAAASLADFFLSNGPIFQVYGRDNVRSGVRNRTVATPDVRFPYPVAVLVDGSTASAAEILAGAINPLPRVTVIGQTTFGKGLIQRVMDIPVDNLLKLTVAEYKLSGDRAIHLRGIEPDIALLPVSTERLGPLGNVGGETIAYLRTPGQEDRFPIEVGHQVVKRGRFTGERAVQEQALEKVREHLEKEDITWPEQDGLPDSLPEAIRITEEHEPFVSGGVGTLRVTVSNPNDFEIPAAWVAVESPTTYVLDRVAPLGRLPAGGSAAVELPLVVPDGLTASELPVVVHVASGARTLQSHGALLAIHHTTPEIEFELARPDEETAILTLRNTGEHAAGDIRVALPGTTRAIERLAPGESREMELPVGGDAREISVTMVGPNVQRRIDVPVVAEVGPFVPPALEVRRTSSFGRSRFEVEALDDGGLGGAWIAVDGEKEIYADWKGKSRGSLSIPLEEGEHGIRTHVTTDSGVAIVDSRLVTVE